MTSLLETIQSYVPSDLAAKAAAQLGESDVGVSRAISGLIPTILSGVTDKAESDNSLGGLFDALSDNNNIGFLDDLGSLLGGGNLARNDPKDIAGAFVGSLFGDKVGGILQAITSFAGLKTGSAGSILGMVGPLVMGALTKRILGDGLSAAGFRQLLVGEQDMTRRAVPPQVANVLGYASAAQPARAAASSASMAAAGAGRPAWLWAVPAVLGLGFVGWMLSRGGDDNGGTKIADTTATEEIVADAQDAADSLTTRAAETVEEANDTLTTAAGAIEETAPDLGDAATTVADATDTALNAAGEIAGDAADKALNATGAVAGAAGEAVNVADAAVDGAVSGAGDKLANAANAIGDKVEGGIYSVTPVGDYVRQLGDFELRGAADGVEAKLIGFIDSETAPCTEAECWFTFDRLTFNTGSAQLDMATSQEQLTNIQKILEAYPDIQLKIGGYTDNTGSDEINMELSQARAEAVVNALVTMGVTSERMVAEGYGPKHPVASNDTSEGRAQNRRIDVRVRQR